MLLECGCTVRLIQKPTMKNDPSVVVWSTHIIVVTEVMIQISQRVVFLIIEERWAALATKVIIPVDIMMTHLIGMKLSFCFFVEKWGNNAFHAQQK